MASSRSGYNVRVSDDIFKLSRCGIYDQPHNIYGRSLASNLLNVLHKHLVLCGRGHDEFFIEERQVEGSENNPSIYKRRLLDLIGVIAHGHRQRSALVLCEELMPCQVSFGIRSMRRSIEGFNPNADPDFCRCCG